MAKQEKKWLPEKWEPLAEEMVAFKKSLDEIFDSFLSRHPFPKKLPSIWKQKFALWRPEIDMYETEQEVIVKANVPGCDKKNVTVHVDDNILTITGEKKEEKEVKKGNFYHREQHVGSFQRSISLPAYVDLNKAKASCAKGVLKVAFPKLKEAKGKGKQIDIG